MSIPCLSPQTPQGLAPNTRYSTMGMNPPVIPACVCRRDGNFSTPNWLLHFLFVAGWQTAALRWLQLETLPGQSSSNTWRDTAALAGRWGLRAVGILGEILITHKLIQRQYIISIQINQLQFFCKYMTVKTVQWCGKYKHKEKQQYPHVIGHSMLIMWS